jgi:DNA-binding transcriptional regulator YdaS (Cro superfamily)
MTTHESTSPLERAKAAAGGVAALAAGLSRGGRAISSQAISQWRQVPAARALEVEALTGISRFELRPDIYGPAPAASPSRVA